MLRGKLRSVWRWLWMNVKSAEDMEVKINCLCVRWVFLWLMWRMLVVGHRAQCPCCASANREL